MQLWHFQSSVSVFILRNTIVLYMVCSLSTAQSCLWKSCHQKQAVTRTVLQFDKDLSAFLKQSVLFFSVLHLRIHNPSQWQRVTFRLTTRSHVRLIEIAVSNLWFGVNKMLSYIYPFHSHDLNINSPHSLPYIAYSVSSENMVLNQTISPSLFFPDSHHLSA